MSPILGARGGLSAKAYGFTSAAPVILGDFQSIATVNVGSGGQSSITFTSIPSTFTHLQIRGIARTNRATFPDPLKLNFNSDTGSNYARHYLAGEGSSASADALSSQTFIRNFIISSSAATSGVFGTFVIDVLDYAATSKYKTVRTLMGYDDNGSGYIVLNSGLWSSTSAISSISFAGEFGTLQEFSSFALYGIKGA
jgi:hypothetical protein